MKRMKLLAGMVLAVALAFSAGYGALSAFAETQAAEENTAVSLDEDFDGSSVLVTMTEDVSEVNKKYDKSYFGDIRIEVPADPAVEFAGKRITVSCFEKETVIFYAFISPGKPFVKV